MKLSLEEHEGFISIMKDYYPMINIELLQLPIQKMLTYPTEDCITVIRYIINYFSCNLGWSLERVTKVIETFSCRADILLENIDLKQEIEAQYNKYYHYTRQLCLSYGYIDFNKTKGLSVPNDVMVNLKILSDNALRMYTIMLLRKEDERKITWSKSELATSTGISVRSLERNITPLINLGLIEKESCSKEKKHVKFRIVQKAFFLNGITLVDRKFINMMILDDKIKLGCLKVYLQLNYLIKYRFIDNKCEEFQREIGECFDRTASRVSELTTDLFNRGYIKKYCYYIPKLSKKTGKMQNIKRCSYELVN